MGTRKVIECGKCALWRTPDGRVLAGTPLGGRRAAVGECRRRAQPGADGLRPLQPETPAAAGCSEGLPLPPPERFPANCAGCSYWRRVDAKEGHCVVWAPRWSKFGGPTADTAGHFAFPVTPADFMCGDGVSIDYVDPDDLDDQQQELVPAMLEGRPGRTRRGRGGG